MWRCFCHSVPSPSPPAPVGYSAPNFPNKDVSRTTLVDSGTGISVFCNAQGHPTPRFR